MITAVIQHKKDTLVVELPKANTDLQIKLLSIGVRTLPQNIKLFGGEDAEIDVQLASSSRVGQHLCRLFNTENSLGQFDLADNLAGHIQNVSLKHVSRSPFLSLLRKPSGDFCRKPSAGSC